MKNPLKRSFFAAILPVILATSGCATFRAGPGVAPTRVPYKGLLNGYFSTSDLPAYDGWLVKADIFSESQPNGELIAVDVWPIGALGVGALGVRVRILTIGMGIGMLFYDPDGSSVIESIISKEKEIEIKIE